MSGSHLVARSILDKSGLTGWTIRDGCAESEPNGEARGFVAVALLLPVLPNARFLKLRAWWMKQRYTEECGSYYYQ
jgi:hypothetical protein